MKKHSIKRLIKKWADRLDERFRGLSFRQQMIVLTMACTLLILFSIYTFCLSMKRADKSGFNIQPIHFPHYVIRPPDWVRQDSIRKAEQAREIKAYRHYLDSLSKDGKVTNPYERLKKQNPGTGDSLTRLENSYQSQLKHGS